jgi:hypothetical protein
MARRSSIIQRRRRMELLIVAASCLALIAFAFAASVVTEYWLSPSLAISGAIILVGISAGIVILARRSERYASDLAKCGWLRCPQCFFDLRGLPDVGRCPECGGPFSIQDLQARWQETTVENVDERSVEDK